MTRKTSVRRATRPPPLAHAVRGGLPLAGVLALCLVLAVSGTPPASAGSLMETRGVGARAIGMGGAYTAVADDVSACYYNPAGLAQIHGHQARFEYLLVAPRVCVREGTGSSELHVDKWTQAPGAGIAIDLSRAIKLSRQIVVGWASYFPENMKSIYKVRFGEFYDPYFPRYGDTSADQSICLVAAAGVELLPWLLVGGGINLQIHGQYVRMDVAVDLQGNPVTEESRAVMEVTTEIQPLLGVLLKPTGNLRIGFSWRRRVEFVVAGGMQLRMSLYLGPDNLVPVPIPVTVPSQGHFRPDQFALGASYRIGKNLLVAADATYYLWHPYRDEAANPLDPPMRDIVVPRAGMEYRLLEGRLALRAGYAFHTSPLRPQRQGSLYNLLDNDVHTVSLGTGVHWDVFGAFPRPIEWSLFYQLQVLVPRTFENVHPGREPLTSSGRFHGFGFGIKFYF